MKYAYYPGCSLRHSSKEYDMSARSLCNQLDIELVEIPQWTCCGSTPAHSTNDTLARSLAIKNLIWPEQQQLPLVTPCAACFSRLKLANMEVQHNKDSLTKINQTINSSYQGTTNIRHLLEIIPRNEEIKKKVKRTLNGIKVVCYYGCLLNRPKGISDEKDFDNPVAMDELMALAGAEVLDWGYKTECCGASFALTHTDIVLKLCGDILHEAKNIGADCIVTACPMCQTNLDMRQEDLKMKNPVPILYFTQLLALAMGENYKTLGLNRHFVNPKKVFEKVIKFEKVIH